jgi:hypothetical protein
MQLLTCPICGEITEIDEDELAIGDLVGVLLCATCESPLRSEDEILQHAMDDEGEVDSEPTTAPKGMLTAEVVEELTIAVQGLTDQVRCLRLAIDEIEAELGWAIRNRVIPQLQPPSLADIPLPVPLPIRSPVDSGSRTRTFAQAGDEQGSSRQANLW